MYDDDGLDQATAARELADYRASVVELASADPMTPAGLPDPAAVAARMAGDYGGSMDAAIAALIAEIEEDIRHGRLSATEIQELRAIDPGWVEAVLASGPPGSRPARTTEHATELPSLDVEAAYASGGSAYGLADAREAIDLAHFRDATRVAEDREPQPRRTQDRLDRAYDRISRGTYEPTRGALEFAGSTASDAASTLARQRWDRLRRDEDPSAQVTMGVICGVPDELGRCGEPYHSPGCASLATPDIASALADSGAYSRIADRPHLDADGRTWASQWGDPLSLTGHLEAAAGQRLAGASLFESGEGPRELLQPYRPAVFGDIDDPDAVPGPFSPGTQRTAAALAAQAGIAVRTADEVRASARADLDYRQAALARRGVRLAQPESTRDRAQRHHRPTRPVPFGGELLNGELGAFEAGAL